MNEAKTFEEVHALNTHTKLVTGSKVGTVFGRDPYMTRDTLFKLLTDVNAREAPPTRGQLFARDRGKRAEPYAIRWITEHLLGPSCNVFQDNVMFYSPKLCFLAATPDQVVEDALRKRVFEVKNGGTTVNSVETLLKTKLHNVLQLLTEVHCVTTSDKPVVGSLLYYETGNGSDVSRPRRIQVYTLSLTPAIFDAVWGFVERVLVEFVGNVELARCGYSHGFTADSSTVDHACKTITAILRGRIVRTVFDFPIYDDDAL